MLLMVVADPYGCGSNAYLTYRMAMVNIGNFFITIFAAFRRWGVLQMSLTCSYRIPANNNLVEHFLVVAGAWSYPFTFSAALKSDRTNRNAVVTIHNGERS